MVMQRMVGIALGCEDLIDHDQLRHDLILATLAGKLEAKRTRCAPLAGKSTFNRLEHAPSEPSRYHAIEGLYGHQEGRFFHGYYDCSCYPGTCSRPSSGAPTSTLQPARSRRWRGSSIRSARAGRGSRSCGFARDELMAWCEANRVDYLFGLARNDRLIGAVARELAAAEIESRTQGGPAGGSPTSPGTRWTAGAVSAGSIRFSTSPRAQ